MTALAASAEKVAKSLLAAVLAISFCPLAPTEKAQAEETSQGGVPESEITPQVDGATASDSVAEGDSLESADSDDEVLGTTVETDSSDNADIALHANESDASTVVPEGWNACGTCMWNIDEEGCLVIKPIDGESGELAEWQHLEGGPWRDSSIVSVRVLRGVKAKTTARMFAACRNLTAADLSGLDASNVTDMSEMFCNCSSLKSVYLSGIDTSSVADMGEMFSGCSKLPELDLSSFNTSNVKAGWHSVGGMYGMFSGCSSLTSLDLSSFDTSNVTGMGNMFSGCSSLTSLDLSSFNTSNVRGMYGMFSGCSSLTSLDLSSFDTSKVENMGAMYEPSSGDGMFSGCSSLKSLDVSSFDTSAAVCMSFMFYGCSSLTSLDLSGFVTSAPAKLSSMFSGCSSLKAVKFADSGKLRVSTSSSMFSGCSKLAELDLSSFDTSNATSTSGMFSSCSSLVSLDLACLDTSNVTAMSYMFSDCSSLASLDLSSFDTSKVTSMDSMFRGCSKLTSLDLSSFNTSSVSEDSRSKGVMTRMFSGCLSLESLNLSSFDTSKVKRMDGMFEGCLRLKDVNLSSFNFSNATSMSYMFQNCQSLEAIEFPVSFDTSKVTGFSNMFSGCRSLERLDVSRLDTSAATSLGFMFSGCSKLASLDASGFKVSGNADIGYMFNGCSSLTSLDLSGFDTSSIANAYGMSGLLAGCDGLRAVTLGPKFSFEGAGPDRQCSLPTPTANGLTGRWVSSIDGVAYASDSIPSNTKATYTAQTTESSEGWSQAGGCVWRVDDEGCLTIKPLLGAETGQLGGWSGSDTPWKLQTSSIKSVVIEKGVIAGQCLDYMFSGCSNLVSADLSGISTSNTTSMVAMFSGCSSLTSLNLAPFDTSSVTKMDSMFRNCASLESLNVSNFDTSKVTSMFAMFNSCSSLKSLDLSSFDTSNVTTMMVMFGDCPSMKTLALSLRFDTSSVENMDKMFAGCAALTALDVSGFDTSKVKTMQYMFSNCKSLASLDVSNFDTSKVVGNSNPQYPPTGVAGMFHGCSSLASLDVSGFDTSQVTDLSDMFSGCSSLTSIDMSGFDTSKVSSMASMFRNCSSLESLGLTSFDTSQVTDASSMFEGCSKLRSLDVSGFRTSNVTSMYGMFSGCSSLESLDLSKLDTSKVADMSFMFSGCSSLESLDLSRFDVSKAENMAGMFSDCPKLQRLCFPDSGTANVTDMSSMFDGCTSLESLDISHFDTSSASNMSSMFWNCPSLRSVALGGKFSFNGSKGARQCALPKLEGDGLTGLWENVETHEAYAEDKIPNNVAATYAAQAKGEVPKTAIDESMFAVDTSAKTYTGSPIEPSVSSTALPALRQGIDYEVFYESNVNAGEGTIVITGKGSYAGQVTCTFRIDPRQIDAPEAAAGLVYGGEEQAGVAPSGDYAVTGGSATNAGSYTAIASLKDKGNCVWADTGKADDLAIAWSIAKADMSDALVAPIDKQAWTGSQLTPEPTVTFNGKTLVKDKDYIFSYGDNKDPGKGTVTVAAVEGGNFTGSVTVWFDIEKKAEPENPDPGTGGASGGGAGGGTDPAPEPQQFSVTYHLDGGVNAASNPATFAAGTAVALADPTKEGCEFQGWYADAALTKCVTEIAADASGDVELWAKWAKKQPVPVFPDVDYSESSWYGKAVTYVAERGLITGYTAGEKAGQFGVGDPLTRAQLATILWRNARPEEAATYDPSSAKDETHMAGSADGQYYTAAANWAVANGVVSGYDRPDGSKDFAAGDDVTFEQLVTILARLCAAPGELDSAGSDLSAFADGGDASSWSRSAFAWAAGKGLVEGYDAASGKLLAPGEDVARERVAVVLMRAFEMGILK